MSDKLLLARSTALLLAVFALITLLYGCSDVEQEHENKLIDIQLRPSELREELISELVKNRVWNKQINDGTLKIRESDVGKVNALFESVRARYLPRGRNTSFRKDLHKKFVKALDEAGIEYKVLVLDGRQWVIWSIEDSEKVRSIIMDISLPNNWK